MFKQAKFKKGVLALGLAAVAGLVLAEAEVPCKVADPDLQGYFSGTCGPEGWAEGAGVARGRAEYVGDFRRGRKHGRGVKTWPSGDRYVGDFVDDRREGYGISVWGAKSPYAGERYTGQYVADMRHGRGLYEWPNGDRYEGEWIADRVTGAATPMQTLQIRHRQAVTAAVAKVGTKVCRDEGVGIAGKKQVSGMVEHLHEDGRISVRISGVEGQGGGDLLRDDPVNWLPCY